MPAQPQTPQNPNEKAPVKEPQTKPPERDPVPHEQEIVDAAEGDVKKTPQGP